MSGIKKAMLGAGCFWGVQSSFDKVKGVLKTTVGYSGGHKENPTYEEVCTDTTGHAEVVLIEYDPDSVSYRQLLMHFFNIHDPTTRDRQGYDFGRQYRSSIMYYDQDQKVEAENLVKELSEKKIFRSPIVTEIVPAGPFYRAEEYHQKYHQKHGLVGCHF
jgi:peptide-methionine (S)-S-oxide reductase